MPYPHSLTTPYDHLKSLSISDLKRMEFLEIGKKKTGTIVWKINNIETGSISIQVDYKNLLPSAILSYESNQKDYYYKVRFTSTKSNLGSGNILYFICPFTGKRCRKLFFKFGEFAHRTYHEGIYESQTWSRKSRAIIRLYNMLERESQAQRLIHSKHFKTHYKGVHTKRYINALRAIENCPDITVSQLFYM